MKVWTEGDLRAALDEAANRPERLARKAEDEAWMAVRELLMAMHDELENMPEHIVAKVNTTADKISLATDARIAIQKARAARATKVTS